MEQKLKTITERLSRNVKSKLGYTHFQISRDTILEMQALLSSQPQKLNDIFEECLELRGQDRRVRTGR